MEENLKVALQSQEGQEVKAEVFRVGKDSEGNRIILLLNNVGDLLAWMPLEQKACSNLSYLLINDWKTGEA